MTSGKLNLLSLTKQEIKDFFAREGEQPFRGEQIFRWMHKEGVINPDLMTNLSKPLRNKLKDENLINSPLKQITVNLSRDGSVKFLFYTAEDFPVESVLIPSGGKDRRTYTLCLSSQSGCAMKCSFCSTAKLGLNANLKTEEIVFQVTAALEYLNQNKTKFPNIKDLPREQQIGNLVFMGMGEPLLNLNNVIPAVKILEDETGLNFSGRRITVSTCGIIPGLKRLAEEIPQVNLAVSLNSPEDSKRTEIMPINEKYPLNDLMKALRAYPLKQRRRITFEYIMFKEFNDTVEDAKKLVNLVKGIKCKFNIIPYNEGNFKTSLIPSPPERRSRFAAYLRKAGFTVIERNSYGQDIAGACGQLAAVDKAAIPVKIK